MLPYPVTQPAALEKILFDAGLVVQVPLAAIYDVKAGTTAQRTWQSPEVCRAVPDIRDPRAWDDKLHASLRGEFFGEALRGCRCVLDVGCGEGFPSLYLATLLPAVVGIDVSAAHLALARHTAHLMGLDNVRFEQAGIEALPYPDGAFDGVCFAGNVFTYGYDAHRMLSEIHRVLVPDGPFAFEQFAVDPHQPPWERIQWFIDGGPPIFHYGAGVGLLNREYLIYLDPQSVEGQRIAELSLHVRDEHLTPEQRAAFEDVQAALQAGRLEIVDRVCWAGEGRSLAADEFPALLHEAGFTNVTSWALPDAIAFARSLAEQGILQRLDPADLRPCLRALVRSAPRLPGWRDSYVMCTRT